MGLKGLTLALRVCFDVAATAGTVQSIRALDRIQARLVTPREPAVVVLVLGPVDVFGNVRLVFRWQFVLPGDRLVADLELRGRFDVVVFPPVTACTAFQVGQSGRVELSEVEVASVE